MLLPITLILLVISSITALYIGFKWKNEKKRKLETEQKYKSLLRKLDANIAYAKTIASGNYYTDFNATGDDALGLSLVEMNNNLKQAEIEDRKRNWAMAGTAKISEIIRVSNHDMESLADSIISYLVKYLEACQGAIFVIDDADKSRPVLEMKGCFAYDRKKYIDKKIDIKQGLVGQSVAEKGTIYLTDIPDDYMQITSGLGGAKPTSVLIVALTTDEAAAGAMELALFRELQPYEIDFVEKVSENIASSLILSKNNAHTIRLLKEAQQLSDQLGQQEEELRQNMEEMQATQEELARKQKAMEQAQEELNISKGHLDRLVDSIPVPINVKDRGHRIVQVNAAFCNIMKKDKEYLIGKTVHDRFAKEQAEKFWEGDEKVFNANEIQVNEETVKYTGDETKTVVTYKYPFTSADDQVYLVTTIVDLSQRKAVGA